MRSGVVTSPDAIFDRLFSVFNDSLPDGWGRLLLNRTVEVHGVRRGQLNPLDRLAEEPAFTLTGESEEVFEELLRLSGSSSGARPEIVAQVSPERKKIVHGAAALKPGFEHWMIRFACLWPKERYCPRTARAPLRSCESPFSAGAPCSLDPLLISLARYCTLNMGFCCKSLTIKWR